MRNQPGIEALVQLLRRHLNALGHWAGAVECERLALKIHKSMGGRSRLFHSRRHAVAMTEGADPVAALAALYHDTVYVQVDLGVPAAFEAAVSPYAVRDGLGWRVAQEPPGFVAALFGFSPGEALSPYAGLNEYLSAAAAVSELSSALARETLLELACCIEATIPFRSGRPFDRLAERLAALGLPADRVRRAVRRAAWVSQKDVANFAESDPGRFLDNTWLLLPETNPALLSPDVYSIRDYRTALQKMEGFLSTLSADRVFQRFDGFPDEAEFSRMSAAASRNLDVSCRYLRAKLAACGVLEALAETTGGDAPISLFMGSLGGRRKLEHWLPVVPPAGDCDPVVLRLLDEGRPTAQSFDIRRAPLAAFVYRSLGHVAGEGVAAGAKRMFKGELPAADLLRLMPADVLEPIASAAARTAVTREPLLRSRPWLATA